jgi:HTH-type transcriptional regulator/antitoxin HipB
MKSMKAAKTVDELLDIQPGQQGTPKRDEFEINSNAFVVGEMIKEARKNAHLKQELDN